MAASATSRTCKRRIIASSDTGGVGAFAFGTSIHAIKTFEAFGEASVTLGPLSATLCFQIVAIRASLPSPSSLMGRRMTSGLFLLLITCASKA